MAIDSCAQKYMPFSSKFIKVNSHRMHYIDEGEGELIYLVHGNPTWSFYYRNVIRELSKNYRVIALDHIGCGLSDRPEDHPYTLEQRISDMEQLIDAIGEKRYSLMVHDWGGAIGFGVAVRRMEAINKIVITNTAAYRSKRIPFSIRMCKLKFFGPFIVKYLNAFCYPATFMTTTRKLSPEIKKAYLSPYKGAKNRKAISEFVQDIPMDEKHRSYNQLTEIEENLNNIPGEKLILWGGKDFCFNESFFNKWREIYPEADFKYFKNAGHYLLEDEFDNVIGQVKSFLGND